MVRYFGPLKEGFHCKDDDDFFSLAPLTVFCGAQATGKSTLAKLYATFVWLEKAFIKEIYSQSNFTEDDFLRLCKNQKIDNYFADKTLLKYEGNLLSFSYEKGKVNACLKDRENKTYIRAKVMYIPAERNLLSVLENAGDVRNLPLMLSLLQDRYAEALRNSEDTGVSLPLLGLKVRYAEATKRIRLVSGGEKEIAIDEASSGVQSLAPLSVVSDYLSAAVSDDFYDSVRKLSSAERDKIKEKIRSLYSEEPDVKNKLLDEFDRILLVGKAAPDNSRKNTFDLKDIAAPMLDEFLNRRFVNIVEEPEQNLYPDSQEAVIRDLLRCMNKTAHNTLLVATHSPYVLGALNNCIYAGKLLQSGIDTASVIPKAFCVSPEKTAAYKIEDGRIFSIIGDDGLINNGEIDSCSDRINAEYQQLCDMEFASQNILPNS